MFESIFGSPRRRKSLQAKARGHTIRLRCEALESRLAPAVIDWTASVDGNFNVDANWTVRNSSPPIHRIPGAGDDAFINPSNITVTISEDQTVNSLSDNARLVISGGVFSVAADSALSTVNLQSGATLQMDGGTTSLNGAGTITGTFDTTAGANLNFSGGTYMLTTGANFINDGVAHVAGATVDVEGTVPATNFALDSGTLTGGGALTVSSLDWTGGTMVGNGQTIVMGSLTIEGAATKSFAARTLEVDGSAIWQGAGSIATGLNIGGGQILNQMGATFDIATDAGFVLSSGGAAPTFTNLGTLSKVAGVGGTAFGYMQLTNMGTVTVQSGALTLATGGTGSGTFDTAAGANLNFSGGTYMLTDGAMFLDDGSAHVAGATVDVEGTVGATNFALDSGTLTGGGALTVSGTLDWTGGTMVGSGGTTVTGNLTIEGPTTKGFAGRTLEVDDTAVWQGAGGIATGMNITGGQIITVAGATFDIATDAGFFAQGGTVGAPTFINLGTLSKVGGIGETAFSYMQLTNTGTVTVQSGTLTLATGGTGKGAFDVAAGAKLNFAGSTYMLMDGANFLDNGFVHIAGGTVDVEDTVPAINLALDGGTLTGGGNLTVSGTLDWTGGTMVGSGRTTAGGSLTIEGTAAKSFAARTLELDGTASWQGASSITTGLGIGGGQILNQAGASFDIATDAGFVFSSGGSAPMFTNLGTLRKVAGVGETVFGYMLLTNAGMVEVQSGALTLASGGTGSGTFDTSAGANLNFAGGTYTLTGEATFSGGGLVHVVSGTVDVEGTVGGIHWTLDGGTLTGSGTLAVSNFTLNSGTVMGSGTLTVSDTLDWTGGTMIGTGRTTVTGSLTIEGPVAKSFAARTLELDGTVSWQGASGIATGLNIGGGQILNAAGATFDIATDAGFVFSSGGSAPTLTNMGILRKVAGVGETVFGYMLLTNAGTVEVQSGALTLASGGTGSGTFDTAAGTKLNFSGGTYMLNTGANFSNDGFVHVAGATMDIEAAVDATNFALDGGTLTGSGTLTVSSTFDWTGGTMVGSGRTTVTGSLVVEGPAAKSFAARTLEVDGSASWQGVSGIATGLNIGGGQILNQAGATFDLATDAGFVFSSGGSAPMFTNLGTLRKTAGIGETVFGYMQLTNMGMVTVQSGILTLASGGTSSGTFDTAAGTKLNFSGGTYTLTAGANFLDDGFVHIASGTVDVEGTVAATNLALDGGALTGGGTLTVSGTLDWTGGTMVGTGRTTVTGALIIEGAATKSFAARTLEVDGTATWQGAGGIATGLNIGGGQIINQAGTTFAIATDASFFASSGGSAPTFTNLGSLRKTAGIGETMFSYMQLNNTGTVEVQSGALTLATGGMSSGTFGIAAGTRLNFSGGTYTLTAGTNFLDDGFLHVAGGTVDVEDAVPAINFALDSGTLTGGGILTVSGTLDWTGGSMVGSGRTTVTGNLIIEGSAAKGFAARTLEVDGTAVWQGSSGIATGLNIGGGQILNAAGATFDIHTDASFFSSSGGSAPTFINQGTLRKFAVTGIGEAVFSYMLLNNTGTVEVQSGVLTLATGGDNTGSFMVSAGARLRFNGGTNTLESGTSLSGDGVVEVAGGTVNVAGTDVTATNVTLSGGTLSGAGNLTVSGTFNLNGGTLAGSGTWTITGGTCNWTGGTIAANGTFTLDAGSTLTISGTATKTLSGGTLNLYGTASWSGGTITFTNGAVFTVEPGAAFIIQTDNLTINAGSGGVFSNQGNLSGVNLTGRTTISGVTFRNENGGSISATSGILQIDNFIQNGNTSLTGVGPGARLETAGNLTISSGILVVDGTFNVSGNLTLQGGVLLVGSGTVRVNNGSGNVENMAGTISPGGDFAVGTLTIDGNFINDAQGMINIDIGGTDPDSGYDQLSVTGRITLGGILNATFLDSYTFADGDSFNVLVSRAGMTSGDFATYNVFNLDSNYQVTHAVNGGSLVLTVSALGDSPETGRGRSGSGLLVETALAIALADDFPVAAGRHDGKASGVGV